MGYHSDNQFSISFASQSFQSEVLQTMLFSIKRIKRETRNNHKVGNTNEAEAKEIKRDIYLNKLITKKHNGAAKVVTGIRRCGESYLPFNLFRDCLI